MTYCVAIKLNAGLVFLSDSRTNAGLDQISTFRKMIIYEKLEDRFMVLLSAGNLSISQSVREILQVEQLKDHEGGPPITIWNAKSMFDAARVLGAAIRRVHERDAGETLACGTGACAAVVVGILAGWLAPRVEVHTRGGALLIEWQAPDGPVLMTGPAATVYEGEIEL